VEFKKKTKKEKKLGIQTQIQFIYDMQNNSRDEENQTLQLEFLRAEYNCRIGNKAPIWVKLEPDRCRGSKQLIGLFTGSKFVCPTGVKCPL
jgi:hypothetical protein